MNDKQLQQHAISTTQLAADKRTIALGKAFFTNYWNLPMLKKVDAASVALKAEFFGFVGAQVQQFFKGEKLAAKPGDELGKLLSVNCLADNAKNEWSEYYNTIAVTLKRDFNNFIKPYPLQRKLRQQLQQLKAQVHSQADKKKARNTLINGLVKLIEFVQLAERLQTVNDLTAFQNIHSDVLIKLLLRLHPKPQQMEKSIQGRLWMAGAIHIGSIPETMLLTLAKEFDVNHWPGYLNPEATMTTLGVDHELKSVAEIMVTTLPQGAGASHRVAKLVGVESSNLPKVKQEPTYSPRHCAKPKLSRQSSQAATKHRIFKSLQQYYVTSQKSGAVKPRRQSE